MNRAEVSVELGLRLGSLMADVALAAEDLPGQLKEPLDDALRMMGVLEVELATADVEDPASFIVAARYQTLRTIRDRMADRIDISLEGDSFRQTQAIATVEKMIAEAAIEVEAVVSSASGSGFLIIDTNYLQDPANVYGEWA